MQSQCTDCENKISRFVKKQEAKSNVLSKVPLSKDIKTPLRYH